MESTRFHSYRLDDRKNLGYDLKWKSNPPALRPSKMHFRRGVTLTLFCWMCLSGAFLSVLSAQGIFAAAVNKAPLQSDEVPDENSAVLVEKEVAESLEDRAAEIFILPLNLLDNIPHGPTHFHQPSQNVSYSAAVLSTYQQLLI